MTNPFYGSTFWKALRRQALDRDHWRCTVPGCPNTSRMGRLYVDHIQTRQFVPFPTALDVLENLRTLCGVHDAQVKEQRGGRRRKDGKLTVKGCDALGNPLCPTHHWNKPT